MVFDMSVIGGTMGILTLISIFTICSHTVYASVHDFNQDSDSSDYYQHREWYNPGIRRRGFGPPNHRFGYPPRRFRPHGWNEPHSNNRGYGYDRPKTSWNEYQDYDNYFARRTQDDYWIFPDTEDRFPPRDQFPAPSTFAPAPTIPPRPVTSELTPSTISPEIQTCIRSCPVTSEFNPVCGSNNVTYSNPSRLQCAQWCGVDVQLKRSFSCSVPAPSTAPVTINPFTPSVPPTAPPTQPPPTETTTEFDFMLNDRYQTEKS